MSTSSHGSLQQTQLDFVSRLPWSDGNTVILTLVERFSKMAHFVPLPKRPLAKETTQLIIQNDFRLHGLPKHVLPDRGPHFSSIFWREFCWGGTASLSSSFLVTGSHYVALANHHSTPGGVPEASASVYGTLSHH